MRTVVLFNPRRGNNSNDKMKNERTVGRDGRHAAAMAEFCVNTPLLLLSSCRCLACCFKRFDAVPSTDEF